VANECTIQCLEGLVEVVTGSGVKRLPAGHVIVLPKGQQHALRARTEAAVLVTLLLEQGDAGDAGGAGNRRDLDKHTPTRP
jgi:quercetin dioxygenase-like cupin family protein